MNHSMLPIAALAHSAVKSSKLAFIGRHSRALWQLAGKTIASNAAETNDFMAMTA
jgi:hypothetical protein